MTIEYNMETDKEKFEKAVLSELSCLGSQMALVISKLNIIEKEVKEHDTTNR